jgi:hypothetical protein
VKHLKSIAILCALPMIIGSRLAHAQLSLPSVQLPNVQVNAPQLDRPLERTVDAARNLRGLRVRELLHRQSKVIDSDSHGEPIVRSEVLAISPTDEALTRAQTLGFTIARKQVLNDLGVTLIVLRAPEGMSTRRALRELQRADPTGSYDFNHLYLESGEVAAADDATPSTTIGVPSSMKVGLIDGGIDRSHPVFAGGHVSEYGCDHEYPTSHGTAVASLLVGSSAELEGAAPNAQLYAADVYCGASTGGAVDAIANAFGWLVHERVPVINVSLVGPANRVLEQVVRIAIERGHIVVAAVGNDGPSAPTLYPAGYAGVIGVTAVDARHHVLLEACRGDHVRFAALGADISAAGLEHSYAPVRGTSFAAPLVAGMLAQLLKEPDRANADAAIRTLSAQAMDLGPRGPDKTYGAGFVDARVRFAQSN